MAHPEKTFEQALEEFLPVSESRRREFLKNAQDVIEAYGTSTYVHRKRPVALYLYRGDHNGVHFMQSFERLGEGKIDIVIQFRGQPGGFDIDWINRAASKEGGRILSHAGQVPDMSPTQLRTGDTAVLNEFTADPERFVRYNRSDALPTKLTSSE